MKQDNFDLMNVFGAVQISRGVSARPEGGVGLLGGDVVDSAQGATA